MKPEYRFELTLIDDTNDELVYKGEFLSLDSMEEKTYQITRAMEEHEEKLKAKEEEDNEDEEI